MGKPLMVARLKVRSIKPVFENIPDNDKYEALTQSKSYGKWVDYIWKEKQKHSYVKTTVSGLIVGSGYSE